MTSETLYGDSLPTRGLPAGLYIVATPIGNLGDITLRAIDILRRAAKIACEDTRHSRKLLTALTIPGPERLLAYHEHNADHIRPALMAAIENGESVALISDAGTPLINDPGYRLVADCRARDFLVTGLPGPSAPLLALSIAGLPTDQFFYAGFPPRKPAERLTFLQTLSQIPGTLVFLESPHRILRMVMDAATVYGDRQAALCRELTKLHEEILCLPLPALAEALSQRESLKGEIVLLIGPADKTQDSAQDGLSAEERLDEALQHALETLSLRDAAAMVAEALAHPRKDVYKRALALTKK